jgi:MoxR-like ATPase
VRSGLRGNERLTPQVQKQLNAIADFRKSVSLPHIGKTYRLKPGAKLWLLGSMNPAVYGGTYDLNEDLKSRFEEVEVTYPEAGQERSIIKAVGAQIDDETLTSLMMLAKETRAVGGSGSVRYPLSTRDLVRMTHNIPKVGLETTLQMMIGKFENEDKDIVLKRLPSIFKAGIRFPKKFWGAVA